MKQIRRRRGRPSGYRLSQESKERIAISRTGQKQSEKTKKKISDGVRKYHQTGAPIEVIMNTDLEQCGTFKSKAGYINICIPNPSGGLTYKQRYHTALIEQALERKLVAGEEIHHWLNKEDNRKEVISLCKNRSEHNLKDKLKRMFLDGCEID